MGALPNQIDRLARDLARRLIEVDGIAALVLGGSWSRGEAHPASDLDIGLYYHESDPPDLSGLSALAMDVSPSTGPQAVTAPGEWGKWVNGGAWLEVEGLRVDWLYRDLGRVIRVIDDCHAGRVECDYYFGHPHGFHSHYYLAELNHCVALEDPEGVVAGLKERVADYPEAMRAELIRRFSFDAEFMLEQATKTAARGDVFHAVGCLFRTVAAIAQVLFALERRYCMNEKGAILVAAGFACAPPDLASRADGILGDAGRESVSLRRSTEAARGLLDEVLAAARDLA